MLCGDSELLLGWFSSKIMLLKLVLLFHDLQCITEEFLSFSRYRDPLIRPVEDGYPDLPLQLPDRA